uniref:Uncharacterized protein n=1 Tax=Arundo donax TaxID=35708 RepID=A0A0A9ABA3_ARUDO
MHRKLESCMLNLIDTTYWLNSSCMF